RSSGLSTILSAATERRYAIRGRRATAHGIATMPTVPSKPRPVISFLSDFGLDGAAAICRGVMLSISPDAQIIDIAHSIRKFAVGAGASTLSTALPFMPTG